MVRNMLTDFLTFSLRKLSMLPYSSLNIQHIPRHRCHCYDNLVVCFIFIFDDKQFRKKIKRNIMYSIIVHVG
jgi:hypothetical protein